MMDAHMHCLFDTQDKKPKIDLLREEMQRNGIKGGILYFINDCDYIENNYTLDFGDNIFVSIALDPRAVDIDERLNEVHKSGVRIIKLLPYEQQILYKDYDIVCEYANKLQKKGMILTICGAYGSKDVYNTNGVELAARILNSGFKNPLILAHGGMVRQLETHSLMCEYDNLYFDISFTIKYWWGSHVIDDLHFVMEKSNYEKIFFGSDYPNDSFEVAIEYFEKFCDKYRVSEQNKHKILKGNFEKFCQNYLSM